MDLGAKDSSGEYVIPADAHARLAHEAKTSIKRRAYNYTAGTNDKTGALETGLLFISFQKATQQFIDIQNHLGHKDKLNEYITHRASATFIVLPGVKKEDTSVKHYSIKILIVLILILSLFKIAPVHAENASMSEAYVSITDAKSTISDNSKRIAIRKSYQAS